MIPVLFTLPDTTYKLVDGTDCYDETRNALTWLGGCPAIFHPPCRNWGRYSKRSLGTKEESELAIWAVHKVREYGGVLEHPAHSKLWPACGLPSPGKQDSYGGITFPINQNWFGHPCYKPTFLYIVGIKIKDIPEFPYQMNYPTQFVQNQSKKDRMRTPLPLCRWLVDLVTKID